MEEREVLEKLELYEEPDFEECKMLEKPAKLSRVGVSGVPGKTQTPISILASRGGLAVNGCPYCGKTPAFSMGEIKVVKNKKTRFFTLACTNSECEKVVIATGLNKEDTVTTWNTRGQIEIPQTQYNAW